MRVRYQSGKLIDVMMDFLGARNVNDLQLTENHPNYKKLDKFLMKLRIKVLSGPGGKRSRIKSIRGIVPAGGNYTFYKESEGEEITVAVRITLFRYYESHEIIIFFSNTSTGHTNCACNIRELSVSVFQEERILGQILYRPSFAPLSVANRTTIKFLRV